MATRAMNAAWDSPGIGESRAESVAGGGGTYCFGGGGIVAGTTGAEEEV